MERKSVLVNLDVSSLGVGDEDTVLEMLVPAHLGPIAATRSTAVLRGSLSPVFACGMANAPSPPLSSTTPL